MCDVPSPPSAPLLLAEPLCAAGAPLHGAAPMLPRGSFAGALTLQRRGSAVFNASATSTRSAGAGSGWRARGSSQDDSATPVRTPSVEAPAVKSRIRDALGLPTATLASATATTTTPFGPGGASYASPAAVHRTPLAPPPEGDSQQLLDFSGARGIALPPSSAGGSHSLSDAVDGTSLGFAVATSLPGGFVSHEAHEGTSIGVFFLATPPPTPPNPHSPLGTSPPAAAHGLAVIRDAGASGRAPVFAALRPIFDVASLSAMSDAPVAPATLAPPYYSVVAPPRCPATTGNASGTREHLPLTATDGVDNRSYDDTCSTSLQSFAVRRCTPATPASAQKTEAGSGAASMLPRAMALSAANRELVAVANACLATSFTSECYVGVNGVLPVLPVAPAPSAQPGCDSTGRRIET